MLFDTFREVGLACAVVRRLRSEKILFPRRIRRGIGKGDVLWSEIDHSRVIQILHNPRYAGAFPSISPYSGRCRGPTGRCSFLRPMKATSRGTSSSAIKQVSNKMQSVLRACGVVCLARATACCKEEFCAVVAVLACGSIIQFDGNLRPCYVGFRGLVKFARATVSTITTNPPRTPIHRRRPARSLRELARRSRGADASQQGCGWTRGQGGADRMCSSEQARRTSRRRNPVQYHCCWSTFSAASYRLKPGLECCSSSLPRSPKRTEAPRSPAVH